jgi:hypothetical protein
MDDCVAVLVEAILAERVALAELTLVSVYVVRTVLCCETSAATRFERRPVCESVYEIMEPAVLLALASIALISLIWTLSNAALSCSAEAAWLAAIMPSNMCVTVVELSPITNLMSESASTESSKYSTRKN